MHSALGEMQRKTLGRVSSVSQSFHIKANTFTPKAIQSFLISGSSYVWTVGICRDLKSREKMKTVHKKAQAQQYQYDSMKKKVASVSLSPLWFTNINLQQIILWLISIIEFLFAENSSKLSFVELTIRTRYYSYVSQSHLCMILNP